MLDSIGPEGWAKCTVFTARDTLMLPHGPRGILTTLIVYRDEAAEPRAGPSTGKGEEQSTKACGSA